MTFKPDPVSARNVELRAMLIEAQMYRRQGRPLLADVIEAEAKVYRAETLRMVAVSWLNPETVFA